MPSKPAPGTPAYRRRYATGGLVLASQRGPEYFARISRGGSILAYGESAQARSVRAADMARRKTYTDRQWQALMRSRAASFNVPLERLLPELRTKKAEEATA